MKKIIKLIYKIFPFKKEIFKVVKTFYSPSESIYRHLYFNGPFKIQIDNNHSFKLMHYGYSLENEIFWRGLENCWEKKSISLWIELCKTSDVVVDIGANNGIYSLISKSLNPQAKVYAFEPVKRIYDKLIENVNLNSFDINCIEKATSDSDGEGIIYDTTDLHSLTASMEHQPGNMTGDSIETTIQLIKLSTFIEKNNIAKVDLMKIDVEGHEPEVLRGFEPFFDKFRPNMLIEIVTDEKAELLQKLVENKGYLFFNIHEKQGVRKVERLTKSDYYNFLLCDEKTAQKLKLV
jgi:FkbM family methyltransferase